MPIVTIRPVSAAWMASRTTSWKACAGSTTWSAANEPMIAVGSRRSMSVHARPIAAAESLGEGSSTRSVAESSGSCSCTAPACERPVTTISGPADRPSSRS